MRDWVGGYVRSTRTIVNRLGEMPPGTVYRVRRAEAIARLVSIPCAKCGLKFSFSLKGKNKFDDFIWLGYDPPTEHNGKEGDSK